jgi:glycosyltransferase involved in cell wall biosynthesis
VAESGLERVVSFPGGRRPAVDVLAEADLFLLTSQREGLPLSVLEAGAAGCPVVAPEVGSVPDAVRHRDSGWLFPSTAGPDEIADLVAAACADRAALDRAGLRARQVYEQHFTLERVADAVEKVYRDTCRAFAQRRNMRGHAGLSRK